MPTCTYYEKLIQEIAYDVGELRRVISFHNARRDDLELVTDAARAALTEWIKGDDIAGPMRALHSSISVLDHCAVPGGGRWT